MLVVALGILQIAVGAVIIASTTGLLTQLGWGLIAEGVNDICTGAYAVWKRDEEFMKSWMIGKAVSIAISVASFGYSQVKNAAKGAKGVKATVSAIKENFKAGAEKVISEFKAMGSMITSKSFVPVLKTTCVEVGKKVGIQLAKRGGQYLLEVVQEKVMNHFENIAKESIKKEIQLAFTDHNGEMHPMIDDFIYLHYKRNTPNDQICGIYMKITKQLLCSENICQFRQVLMGCVKDVLKTTSKQMKSEQNKIFEQCKPIFDIINGLSCASYDVKQLVSIYCKHVKTALSEIYTDSLNSQECMRDKEKDPTLIRNRIIDETVEFLFRLLKESFQFTGTGMLAEKLQAEVGKFVNEYGGENYFGKETIGKIIAISSKAGQIGKNLATTTKIDVHTVVETGCDAAETFIDNVADGKTKQIVGFGLRTTKKSIKAVQSRKTSDVMDAAIDIADDTIDKFANENIRGKARFALHATKKGVKAFNSGKTEEMFNTATNVALDGIDKFADDDVKHTANFALNATKKGVKAFKSGKTGDLFDSATNIALDGIDKFADDDVKHTANFALNATKKELKLLKLAELKICLMLQQTSHLMASTNLQTMT
ncbi:unnamed protein product [Mytilus edulis]|uniref:Uncharacterized protein n=1 Tax=Mytilus edulis TaxID=6550 RepID=A0A8S3Q1S9_MYTED|nr:unnamed protein product [Mytilus edulis]